VIFLRVCGGGMAILVVVLGVLMVLMVLMVYEWVYEGSYERSYELCSENVLMFFCSERQRCELFGKEG